MEQLTQPQLDAALKAGLEILNPTSSRVVLPLRSAAGALILYEILQALANRELALIPTMQEEETAEEQLDEPNGTTPPDPAPPGGPTPVAEAVTEAVTELPSAEETVEAEIDQLPAA